MFLGFALAFVLVFVLAFLLLGFASPPRYQIKLSRDLPVPPERVWPYLADPPRFPHWFPYVSACDHAGGPISGTGQRRKVVLDLKGRPGEREEEATLWEENRALELSHLWEKRSGRPVRWTEARNEYRLEPLADGTRLTGVLWFSGRGMMGRIFSLLFLRKMQEKHLRLGLANLEKRLREETYPA